MKYKIMLSIFLISAMAQVIWILDISGKAFSGNLYNFFSLHSLVSPSNGHRWKIFEFRVNHYKDHLSCSQDIEPGTTQKQPLQYFPVETYLIKIHCKYCTLHKLMFLLVYGLNQYTTVPYISRERLNYCWLVDFYTVFFFMVDSLCICRESINQGCLFLSLTNVVSRRLLQRP